MANKAGNSGGKAGGTGKTSAARSGAARKSGAVGKTESAPKSASVAKSSGATKVPVTAGAARGGDDLQVAESRVRALEEQLEAVRAIGEALSNVVGLDAVFHHLVPNVTRLMRAERTTLFLYDPLEQEIWSKVAEGEGGREIRLRLGMGLAGWVAEQRQTLNIGEAYHDPRFNPEVDARTGFRTTTVLATPILDRNGELLGVIQVLNRRGGTFSDEDEGLLRTIAVQASYAVENARMAQQLLDQNRELDAARHRAERRRAELDLLYQLEQETSASSDFEHMLDSIIQRACERLRSAAGSVLLLDDTSGRLYFRGASGDRASELKKLSLEPGAGVVGWVAENGQPVVVNRPEDDPRHDRTLAERLDVPAHALLAVPLVWDNKVIGAVEVLNPSPRPTGAVGYDLEDLKVLTLIAGLVARAVSLTRERQGRFETERLAFIGRMLAAVAHDLRNPMTVISGYAQMMALEDDGAARTLRCDRILAQIDEMTAMISDLLAFARGDSTLKPTAVALDKLAQEIRDTLQLQCKPRNIVLDVEGDATSLVLDVGRVKRIVFNLARNAIEAMSRDGRLAIRLSESDAGLTLTVEDNGPGLPEEVRQRLFQPFVTVGKKGGTGLGLSIVKRFVDDHRGEVTVESAPGQGTRFVARLRAAESQAPALRAAGAEGSP